ncbi:MAG TPA: hypothetical protein VJ011_12075 [Steroidobacteraceae bacterium]|nr:hypothetical protein [Steroidobacteraceae bacterium]
MKLILSLATLSLCAAGSAYGACSYPQSPSKLPDGNTATMEEMQAAAKAVRQYDADINAYVACLKLEHDQSVAKDAAALTDEQKKEIERMQVQKHNAAIDELEGVATRFNEQVKVFKAKNDKKKS